MTRIRDRFPCAGRKHSVEEKAAVDAMHDKYPERAMMLKPKKALTAAQIKAAVVEAEVFCRANLPVLANELHTWQTNREADGVLPEDTLLRQLAVTLRAVDPLRSLTLAQNMVSSMSVETVSRMTVAPWLKESAVATDNMMIKCLSMMTMRTLARTWFAYLINGPQSGK